MQGVAIRRNAPREDALPLSDMLAGDRKSSIPCKGIRMHLPLLFIIQVSKQTVTPRTGVVQMPTPRAFKEQQPEQQAAELVQVARFPIHWGP